MKSDAGALAGIFTKPAEVIADILSSQDLFVGGPEGGLRVLMVYMAYAGKRLSPAQRQSLERAREILVNRTREAEEKAAAAQEARVRKASADPAQPQPSSERRTPRPPRQLTESPTLATH